jgi:hypothetical protein
MGLPVAEGARIERTYAGFWQRAAGAWSWSVQPQIGAYAVGSQYPVTELLRAHRLLAVQFRQGQDWHVFSAEGMEHDRRRSGELWESGRGCGPFPDPVT